MTPDPEPGDVPEPGGGAAQRWRLPPASDGSLFAQQPFHPGDGWYDYDVRTHVLTPRAWTWGLDRGAGEHRFSIESYYDRRGDSGFFRLQVVPAGGAQQRFALTSNIKDSPVCLAFSEPPREVPCTDPAADAVGRINFRPVLSAGFSVANPGIFPLARPDGTPATLRRWNAATPDLARGDGDALPLADLLGRPFWDAVAGGQSVSLLQLTGSLHMAQWQVRVRALEDDASVELTWQARCQPAASSATAQQPLAAAALRTGVVRLDDATPARVLVSLCTDPDGAVTVAHTLQATGMASDPDSRTWDLALERDGDGWRLSPAAGALLLDVSDQAGEEFRPVTIPAGAWDA
jgi:hypothetical protein